MNTTIKKETDQNFIQASNREEEKLRELFTLLEITENIEFTERNSYAAHDCTFTKDNQHFVVEAKIRNCSLGKYPTHILEEDKLNKLLEIAKEGYKPLYINFFSDGAIIYNLEKRVKIKNMALPNHQLNFSTRKMPNYSLRKSEVILKSVAELSYSVDLKDRLIQN